MGTASDTAAKREYFVHLILAMARVKSKRKAAKSASGRPPRLRPQRVFYGGRPRNVLTIGELRFMVEVRNCQTVARIHAVLGKRDEKRHQAGNQGRPCIGILRGAGLAGG